MKVSDFQKYLRSLAEAIGAAKGPNKELSDAANALTPFGQHTMAEFATFLQLAEVTYRDGKLPLKAEKVPPPPAPDKVTLQQLLGAMGDIRERLVLGAKPTTADLQMELGKFEVLKKGELEQVVKDLGYKTKPKTKAAAIPLIASRLLAGDIAAARTEV